MSAPVEEQAPAAGNFGERAAPDGSDEPGARPPRARRRRRWLWVLAGVVLVVAFVLVVLALRPVGNGRHLDPDNRGPNGTRAVAQVLRRQGVEVVEVHDRAELLAAGPDARTTVLVAPADVSYAQLVPDDLRPAARVVRIVDPFHLTPLAPDEPAPAPCDLPELSVVRAHGVTTGIPAPAGWSACLPDPKAPQRFALIHRDREITVSGSHWLTNAGITSNQDAAMALRLLGQQPRVIWYTPVKPTQTGAGERVAPEWFGPATVQLLAVGVALVLVCGRRLGRLATEPMPVVIRATETTLSRARLLQRGRDRAYAMSQLQTGTRHRISRQLGLAELSPEQLCEVLAGRTPRTVAELRRVLFDPPANDRELAERAQALLDIEREVRP